MKIDRQRVAIQVLLAGLEASLLAPFTLWVYLRATNAPALGISSATPLGLWLTLWGVLCLWMLAVGLLGRMLDMTRYRWAIVAALAGSTLLLLRDFVYGAWPLGDLSWLALLWQRIFTFVGGISPELVTLLLNVLLWQRAIQLVSYHTHFFYLSRRIHIAWVIAGILTLIPTSVTAPHTLPLLWAAFPMGMAILTLGRSEEKARLAANVGTRAHTGPRVVQFVLLILFISGVSVLPLAIPTEWLLTAGDRIVGLLLFVVLQALMVLIFLLYPLVYGAVNFFLGLTDYRDTPPPQLLEPVQSPMENGEDPYLLLVDIISTLPPWAVTSLRIMALLLLSALGAGLIWLLLRPLRRRRLQSGTEEIAYTDASALRRGIWQLRNLLTLSRKIGFNRELLATISVQNIYANLSRMAARRSQPRPPHVAPDAYLETLVQVFGGHRSELERITNAYMKVDYGDLPVTPTELKQVQADYNAVRHTYKKTTS